MKAKPNIILMNQRPAGYVREATPRHLPPERDAPVS